MQQANAPLFRDPIHDGAADPTIIRNHEEQSWWILYTNRRANVACQGVSWVHGTDIGIVSSADHGRTWSYRGILEGLEFERGRNTFWAPEVLRHEDMYHMYVSYVPGVPSSWAAPRYILHMTSRNLWDWRFESKLSLSSDKVIDACVFRLPGGGWRMWYKDEAAGSHTYAADSDDLYTWRVVGPVITDCPHEGPNVFQWQGVYWMITDTWKGQAVYRSDNLDTWTRQSSDILGQPGRRPDDGWYGLHADVLVNGDRAFIFYFTHPERKQGEQFGFEELHPFYDKRTSLQAAELEVNNGILCCNRDKEFDLTLIA